MKYNDEDTILANGKNASNEETTIINDGASSSNDEGTLINDEKSKESTKEENNMDSSLDSEQSETSNTQKGVNWKQVAVTTSSAAVMGAAGVLLTSFVNANIDLHEDIEGEDSNNETGSTSNTSHSSASNVQQPNEEQGHDSATSENVAEVRVDGLSVAHSVSEDMSFDEAFTAARQEVGPGGVFEWHGGVYGTYYASEWNAMSDEEHQEFGSHISYRDNSDVSEQSSESSSKEEIAEVEVEQEAEVIDGNVAEIEVEDTSSIEVELLGHDVVTLEDGSQVEMGFMEVDGHNAVVVDVDVDGSYDILGVDVNDNGELESNELADIQGAGMTVQSFDDLMNADNDLYAELPDYTNDADPSSFT